MKKNLGKIITQITQHNKKQYLEQSQHLNYFNGFVL
jgi:hypothetical protein